MHESLRSKTLGFLFYSKRKENTTVMTEYNITDEEINEEINEVTTKMEDQFVKLSKFLDDRTPKEKLETINKQIEQFQQEKYYLEKEIALKSKEQHQQFINFFKELSIFAKTIDGLSLTTNTDVDDMPIIEITYMKNNEEVFTYSYFYQYDFPKRTLVDLKEELTMAIAIANQLEGKLDYEQVYNAKYLLNPIELTDENVVVSFNKQTDNYIIVKAEKTTHTYKDGFIITLDDVTTLKTYGFDDDVSQTICDTRIITDFNQLYPLLKDMIHNINNWQSKTTIV